MTSIVLWLSCVLLLLYSTQTTEASDEGSLLHEIVDEASNSSLLWGTYRPNLYFGTRPRLPESLMTGLMWFDGSHFQGFQRKYRNTWLEGTQIHDNLPPYYYYYYYFVLILGLRHSCEQGDGLTGYGYHKHNGRNFAKQILNDGPSNIKITTEFIKIPGQHGKKKNKRRFYLSWWTTNGYRDSDVFFVFYLILGGDWAVRIHGQPIQPQGNMNCVYRNSIFLLSHSNIFSFIFY